MRKVIAGEKMKSFCRKKLVNFQKHRFVKSSLEKTQKKTQYIFKNYSQYVISETFKMSVINMYKQFI